METTIIATPIGTLMLRADDYVLIEVKHTDERPSLRPTTHPILRETVQQLNAYFMGERTTFELPLRTQGTAFEQSVYEVLCAIPCGETLSYKDVARRLNRPKAARAVGQACGKNTLLLVVPCHRVIASDGGLGGFALPLEIKAALLGMEKKYRSS